MIELASETSRAVAGGRRLQGAAREVAQPGGLTAILKRIASLETPRTCVERVRATGDLLDIAAGRIPEEHPPDP